MSRIQLANCWLAQSKSRVGPCSPSESWDYSAPKVGGYCVRLVSQSSVHLPLLTVDGLQAGAVWSQHGFIG
ncbi:conserved hypothetical protein [Ricinus communis]|uniref:Uncharacterized protein n=1 Tax=Ricinus communis TaxID=3988 RepID=B9RWN7_RICCO|nr:conserved hypothetical protein [Ricinus communis]